MAAERYGSSCSSASLSRTTYWIRLDHTKFTRPIWHGSSKARGHVSANIDRYRISAERNE